MLVYPAHMIETRILPNNAADTVVCIFDRLVRCFANADRTIASLHAAEGLDDIQRSLRGDQDAYRRLIESYQDHVSRIMWRFSRDRQVHEELVQDVFVEAYLSLKNFKGKSPFSHWLAAIATHVGYAYWKTNAASQCRQLTLADWDQIGAIDQHDDAGQAGEVLFKMLGQLGPRDRLVLTLRYLEDCDVAETSRRTGWTKTMVRVQTMRARARLQKLFVDRAL